MQIPVSKVEKSCWGRTWTDPPLGEKPLPCLYIQFRTPDTHVEEPKVTRNKRASIRVTFGMINLSGYGCNNGSGVLPLPDGQNRCSCRSCHRRPDRRSIRGVWSGRTVWVPGCTPGLLRPRRKFHGTGCRGRSSIGNKCHRYPHWRQLHARVRVEDLHPRGSGSQWEIRELYGVCHQGWGAQSHRDRLSSDLE